MSEPENYVAWLRYVTAGENTKIITCDSNAPGAFRVYRAQDDIYHSCGKHGTIWTGAAMCPDCQAEVDANVAERLAGMRAYFYGIVLGEVASSTGPTGGWLDSPKGVLAAIREALGKNESADAGVRAIERRVLEKAAGHQPMIAITGHKKLYTWLYCSCGFNKEYATHTTEPSAWGQHILALQAKEPV